MNNKFVLCLLMILLLQAAFACSNDIQPKPIETPATTNTPLLVITRTPTPTLMPSAVPLFTFTHREKLDRIAKLQTDNGGCELPCWWGITPGETDWNEAGAILLPLAIENLEFKIASGATKYYLKFPSLPKDTSVNIFVGHNRIVNVIQVGQKYPMADFLRNHSRPSEIWISSDGMVPGPSLFRIAFFYPEKGIMAAYFGKSSITSQNGTDYINICAADFNNSGPLWLWDPNSKKQFDELPLENLIGGNPTGLKLKRIGEYTNFDEVSFYETLVQNPKKACLKTQATVWPNPDLYTTPKP